MRAGRQQPVARDTSTSRSSTMPALWPTAIARPAGMVQHLGDRGRLAAGKHLDLRPGCTLPVATRPQKTRRPWLVSEDDENFSTHCTGKAKASSFPPG